MDDLYTIVTKNHIEYSYNVYTMYFHFYEKYISIYFIYSKCIIDIYIYKFYKIRKRKIKAEFVSEKLDMQYKYYFMVKNHKKNETSIPWYEQSYEKYKIAKNSSEDVNKYINSIEDEVKNTKNIYNTGNVLLDIILYEKSRLCMENNIDFNVGIDFSKCEFIEMIDVSSIFSNLIDNAIEACSNIDDNNIENI